jgi:hypothetical protein
MPPPMSTMFFPADAMLKRMVRSRMLATATSEAAGLMMNVA